jgi:hypothetical protein
MMPPDSPIPPELTETILAKILNAENPLKLAEVVKGLPRPKKVNAADFKEEVRKALEEAVQQNRLFATGSGKKQETRYWSRDETQVLKDRAVALASVPQSMSSFRTALGKEIKGVDGPFIEATVRELIGDDRLFEYPPKTKAGGPLFGASPPPPPLEQPKNKKALDKLVAECRKLSTTAGVSSEELLRALRTHLIEPGASESNGSVYHTASLATAQEVQAPDPVAPARPGPEGLILKAVSVAPIWSLSDLRQEMPPEFRSEAFDEAVLRLADERLVVIHKDADPARFSDEERQGYVQDGGIVFTTISKWS